MSEIQAVEKMAIIFNAIYSENLSLVNWDIKSEKGVALVSDKDGNTYKITIEPQKEVTT